MDRGKYENRDGLGISDIAELEEKEAMGVEDSLDATLNTSIESNVDLEVEDEDIFEIEDDLQIEDDLSSIKNELISIEKNANVKTNKYYIVVLAISISVSIFSGYKYIMNLRDKGLTDKANDVMLELGQPEVIEDTNPYLDVDLKPLKEKNADTVGWLKVGAVGVDIPIVQTTDNEYYLTNDIDKKKNSSGWVFVDCKSNLDHMSTNTVIYGHNVRGRHFGLLKKLLDEEVASKEGADIIQLTTEDKQMVFEIVSVYVTNYNNWDYVKGSFSSDAERSNFVNMLKESNKVKSFDKESLSASDRYLTFSTCHGTVGTNNRLVVHSRLIASRPIPNNK